jgi:hypothetical protein
MLSRRFARSIPLLIVAALPGCDNVIWGGSDIQIVPPPPPQSAFRIETDVRAFSEFGLPTAPVVFHLTEHDGSALLVPIGELGAEGIRPLRRPSDVSPEAFAARFRETVVPVGGQFSVFRRGARVGTFTATGEGPISRCGIPTVTGTTTVVAAAVGSSDYLAFREGLAPTVRGEYSPPQITGSIRTYASIVAERLILQSGLPRPRSWPGAQRDLQAIEIMPGGHPEMATTYLVGDQLAVGPADPEGYSVFYIADYETQRGYQPIYSEVRDYRKVSPAAPRFVDYVDMDSDDSPEVVVEVFGPTQSWYDIISKRDGNWVKVLEGSACGEG